MKSRAFACCLLAASCLPIAFAGEGRLTVSVDKPEAKVSPMLWGIFFEDINCSADGGIYPELVRNRSFEDAETPEHWSLIASGLAKAELAVDSTNPVSEKNPHSLKVTVQEPGTGRVALVNEGFWGMSVRKGQAYALSLSAKGSDSFSGPLVLTVESKDGLVYAKDTISKLGPEWRQYKLSLKAKDTDPQARLVISTSKPGTFWLDMVSLMPRETWKGHGLRPDLSEMLAGLKPSFNRFPGGCWVEGDTMKHAYRWKQTIGDISERRTQYNIWRYHATHGLGFHEYLVMCEDLGTEPLFVINCGMSHKENVPMDKLDEFVQDALDAIEYCNGPATSKWGAVRARAGHPAPFHLKYMEIGNENGGPAYQERYAVFHDAIKSRYPEMVLIGNVPTTQRKADIVDEHYYNTPEFFIQQAHRYDSYKRDGAKIYVGEYAVTQGAGKGNLRAAVGEAAFMTGMERNADVVAMASYAPLFVNVNHRGWNPDLICYDTCRVYGIPSYYVQQMFSKHRGDVVLPVEIESADVTPKVRGGAIGVGTWLTQAEFKDINVTGKDGQTLFASDFSGGTRGWRLPAGEWKAENGVLRQSSNAENIRAITGDKSWTDYTLTLKARKVSGKEGFLILFGVRNDRAKSWWNIGGWGNARSGIEMEGVAGNDEPCHIETGRWYDIRVEYKGSNIKCYLDGKLIHDVTCKPMKALYASATRVDKTGEVIIKIVNTADEAQTTTVALNGVKKVKGSAEMTLLTSGDPMDENTLENPTKVAPRVLKLDVKGTALTHSFPGNSVSVLRIPAQ